HGGMPIISKGGVENAPIVVKGTNPCAYQLAVTRQFRGHPRLRPRSIIRPTRAELVIREIKGMHARRSDLVHKQDNLGCKHSSRANKPDSAVNGAGIRNGIIDSFLSAEAKAFAGGRSL